jgi:ArsR family transcriptional regulator, arsenate/arsenite/antimonite-responsive transcriptional repressor
VCHIEAALALPQAVVSRHLAVLRNAGVVDPRRAGNWVHYSLATQADALCREQLQTLRRTFGRATLLREDVARVLKSKGPGACT